MENLKGKTAFITGGASGMGLGIARACAREGMNVVIADFRQSADSRRLFHSRHDVVDPLLLCFGERRKRVLDHVRFHGPFDLQNAFESPRQSDDEEHDEDRDDDLRKMLFEIYLFHVF